MGVTGSGLGHACIGRVNLLVNLPFQAVVLPMTWTCKLELLLPSPDALATTLSSGPLTPSPALLPLFSRLLGILLVRPNPVLLLCQHSDPNCSISHASSPLQPRIAAITEPLVWYPDAEPCPLALVLSAACSYLHSAAVQTRAYPRTPLGKFSAIRTGLIDTIYSLLFALFINAAILTLAAAAFYYAVPPMTEITDIGEAFKQLAPSLGAHAASIIFAVALLASGLNATITGTLAGQIVMEGFLDLKLKPWQRRLLTRGLAIIPAAIVAGIMGAEGVSRLLVLSQVILSLTLPFTVFPLVHFTSSASHMGAAQVNAWPVRIVAALVFLVIAGLNINLVVRSAISGDFA